MWQASPPPDSTRRERRSAEFRDRLFRAAIDLFARKGFAQTTVEDITNAADVGKGTFFNYFPSKDHILSAFGAMQLAKLESFAQRAETSTKPMEDFFRELASQMVKEPARSPFIVRAVLQANLASEPVRKMMKQTHARAQELLTRIVVIGQQRGEIRSDLAAQEIAQAIRQSLLGTLLMWSLYGDASLESRLEAGFRVLWEGVMPRAAEKRAGAARKSEHQPRGNS